MKTRNKTVLIVTGLALVLAASSAHAHRSLQSKTYNGVNMQGSIAQDLIVEHRSRQGQKFNGVETQGSFTQDTTVEYRSSQGRTLQGRSVQGRDSQGGSAFDFGAMKVKGVQR